MLDWVRPTPLAAASRTGRNSTARNGKARVATQSIAAFALLWPLAPVAAEAPETGQAVLLEASPTAIIITGTRSDRAIEQEPYAIQVIDQQQLERELPRTVPEALSELPGVLVQKTASGHGSPYIRGFTGNRTLLVIDGVRYNNATYRDGANEYFAQIDSFTLSQVELIAGPSSALYGSEAVGGVLNLITRPTAMAGEAGQYAVGEQTLRYSSGDDSITSRSALELGKGGHWGLRGGFTLRSYGDVHAADLGILPYTGYEERAADARLDLALSPSWLVTVKHQSLWQDDVPRTHSTVFSRSFAGTSVGDDLLREKNHYRSLTYLKAKGSTASDWLRSIELTLSHQRRSEQEDRIRADQLLIDQGFDSDLLAFSAIASAQLDALDLTYGMDLSLEWIDSDRTDTDLASGTMLVRVQGPVGDDASYDQAGLFVRGVQAISQTLSLEASLRASLVATNIGSFADPLSGAEISFDDSWSNLSGSLRAQWQSKSHRIWAGYSRSFRAPNVADISRFGRSRSNEIEIASLNLEPETFDTVEVGYRYQSDGLQLGTNLYRTVLNDYIATVPTGQIRNGLTEVSKRNAASGHISGIEFWLSAALGGGFSLEGNATWLRGRLTVPGVVGPVEEPISRIQPLTGNLALAWERNDIWARAEIRLADRADQLSSGDLLDTQRIPPGGTPGYSLINVRAGASIAEGLDFTLALNNLLDEAYRSHGSGSNEPGRHIVAGITASF